MEGMRRRRCEYWERSGGSLPLSLLVTEWRAPVEVWVISIMS
jgi:hypothetical protein